MNVNAFSQKDYENEPPSGPEKTNPIQTQFKPNLETTSGLQLSQSPSTAMAFSSLVSEVPE